MDDWAVNRYRWVDFEEDDDDRLPKRYVRNFLDPFDWWNEREFRRRYRFTKEVVMHVILPDVEENLRKPSKRGLPIEPVQQLLIALRFFATASFQIVCADIDFVSVPTVSRVITRVSALLALLYATYIKFPNQEESLRNRILFRNLGRRGHVEVGIPGIDGAVDSVHIRLNGTPNLRYPESFRNRKGYFSLNVQAVSGPKKEFLDLVTRYAGSTHDNRIFVNSRVNARYAQGQLRGALLGDRGYASQPYLYTPFANPRTEGEQRYNRVHARQRNIVEKAFGEWKRRFPCLSKGLANKLATVQDIIIACAVLHNIAISVNDRVDDFEPLIEDIVWDEPQIQHVEHGEAARRALVERYFV